MDGSYFTLAKFYYAKLTKITSIENKCGLLKTLKCAKNVSKKGSMKNEFKSEIKFFSFFYIDFFELLLFNSIDFWTNPSAKSFSMFKFMQRHILFVIILNGVTLQSMFHGQNRFL